MHGIHNNGSNTGRRLTMVIAGGLIFSSVGIGADAATAATADLGQRTAAPVECAARSDASGLGDFFASDHAPLRGDYQRTLALPDGRVLWTFQDAYVATPNGGERLVHSAGLIQDSNCFTLLRGGTSTSPTAWLLPERTTPFRHWFWPLGAAVDSDGDVRIFVAEMRERGSHYLDRVEPVGTWVVRLHAGDLRVVQARRAAEAGPALYGWSVTADKQWTYLYGYCYRQFGWDPLPYGDPIRRGHDFDCSADVRVARVPRGQLDDPMRYWNGRTWGADPRAAMPVMPTAGRPINPAQVQRIGDVFVAVTKQGDWFGDTVTVDVSRSAHGPWTPVEEIRVTPLCEEDCNTYFASIVSTSSPGSRIVVGLSNNTWSGELSNWYRPTFLSIDVPAVNGGTLDGRLRRPPLGPSRRGE